MRSLFKLHISLLTGLILFSGCDTQRRQIRQLDGLVLQQPGEFVRLSDLINPCFSGKIKSDTVRTYDTTVIAGTFHSDTIRKNDTVYVTKTITAPGKTITKTNTIHDTVTNDRAYNALNVLYRVKADSLISVTASYKAADKKASKYELYFWLIVAGIAIFIVIKIVLYFYGGSVVKTIEKIV